MDELAQYSDLHFLEQLARNIKRLTKNVHTNENPVAFLLGGQSGSGKSTLHLLIKRNLKNEVVVIDGDTFRNQHPNSILLDEKYGKEAVNYKGDFSGRMVEELYKELSEKKYNLVVEGTLRTIDTPLKTAKDLKKKGYKIYLYVMAVSMELSYIGTLERYERMFRIKPDSARATSKDIHDQIVEKLPNNIDTLYELDIFDDISLFKRDGSLVYSSCKTPNQSPKAILEQELYSKPSDEIVQRSKKVLELMNLNGHTDTADYRMLENIVDHK